MEGILPLLLLLLPWTSVARAQEQGATPPTAPPQLPAVVAKAPTAPTDPTATVAQTTALAPSHDALADDPGAPAPVSGDGVRRMPTPAPDGPSVPPDPRAAALDGPSVAPTEEPDASVPQSKAPEPETIVPTEPPSEPPTDAATTGQGTSATTAADARTVLIESLDVEGTDRASVKRVVLSESRLVAGREYGEGEIADAARRVKRLPFVLDARPVLRRGSVPGRYLLVFVIEEQSALSITVGGSYWSANESFVASWSGWPEEPVHLDNQVRASIGSSEMNVAQFVTPLTRLSFTAQGAAGGRTEKGRGVESGLLLSGTLAVGVTRYDILGPASRLDVTIGAGRSRCSEADERDFFGICQKGTDWLLRSSLLWPLGRNDSLSLSLELENDNSNWLDWPSWPRGEWRPVEYNTRRRAAIVTWAHDTTDDPFIALRGTRLAFGLGPISTNSRYSSGKLEVRLVWQHFVPVSRTFSIAVGLPTIAERGPTTAGINGERPQASAARLGLRGVRLGRRNRSRLGLEAGVEVLGGGHSGLQGGFVEWGPYASLKFRSRNVVLSFDARWTR